MPSPSTVDELRGRGGRRTERTTHRGGRHAAKAAALVPAPCERLTAHVTTVAMRLDTGHASVDGLAAMLSPAELRVAEAVASGLTNRQAADRLFLAREDR